ncbi:MAG: hypothetical protein ABJO48_07860, partial [Nonlabens ulvanivorans]
DADGIPATPVSIDLRVQGASSPSLSLEINDFIADDQSVIFNIDDFTPGAFNFPITLPNGEQTMRFFDDDFPVQDRYIIGVASSDIGVLNISQDPTNLTYSGTFSGTLSREQLDANGGIDTDSSGNPIINTAIVSNGSFNNVFDFDEVSSSLGLTNDEIIINNTPNFDKRLDSEVILRETDVDIYEAIAFNNNGDYLLVIRVPLNVRTGSYDLSSGLGDFSGYYIDASGNKAQLESGTIHITKHILDSTEIFFFFDANFTGGINIKGFHDYSF